MNGDTSTSRRVSPSAAYAERSSLPITKTPPASETIPSIDRGDVRTPGATAATRGPEPVRDGLQHPPSGLATGGCGRCAVMARFAVCSRGERADSLRPRHRSPRRCQSRLSSESWGGRDDPRALVACDDRRESNEGPHLGVAAAAGGSGVALRQQRRDRSLVVECQHSQRELVVWHRGLSRAATAPARIAQGG